MPSRDKILPVPGTYVPDLLEFSQNGLQREAWSSNEDLKLRILRSSLSGGKCQGISPGGSVTRVGSSGARMLGDLGQGPWTLESIQLSEWSTARASDRDEPVKEGF